MHTPGAWIALILGIVFVVYGIGGGVRVRFGQLAVSGTLGAVLIIIAFLVL